MRAIVLAAMLAAPTAVLAREAPPAAKPAPAAAATTQSGPEKVTSVEGITEYRLRNGLRVLLFPDPSKPTATVNITYLVGSRHENYGETGMAHLLEHLVFKGSTNHPNIPQELTSHGARPNGSTWYDRTNYFETFQASDENLKWALELEADRMVNSFIAKKDLDSEMTVVRNEFEAGENEPGQVLEERVLSTAFLWHNYGKSTIGCKADLEHVPIDRLQAFYRTYYQPDNAVLIVAGKFDEARTLKLIDQIYSPIPRPERALPVTYTADPVQDGERTVTLQRVGDVQVATAAYHGPAASHPDAAPLQVLTQLLTDTPSGRLHKALVETGKASSVSGYFMPTREPGFLIASTQVRKEKPLEDARVTFLQTLDGAVQNPPSKDEVERAKAQILKEVDLMLTRSDRVGLELSEWIAAGDWRLFFLNRDRVRAVTADDVARVASHYLKPSNRTVGLFLPTESPLRAEIPPTPDVVALVKDYKGDESAAVGEAFDPSPANIESRTTRTDLPGGLKLALLPKATRAHAVVAQLSLHLGDEKSLMNQSAVADMTADMLLRGTSKHSRQQIQDEFDRLKARVGISGSPTGVNVSIETVRQSLPEVLKLVTEVLREPSFPDTELEQLRQENLTALEEQKSDPRALASIALRRHLMPEPKGHPRYVSTTEEGIADYKAVTLDQVKAFHRDFYGTQVAEMAVVGDFDAPELQKLAAGLLDGWKSKQPFVRLPQPYHEVAAEQRAIEAPDKANAVFMAGQNLALRDDDPDYPALALGNFMLGGGFLNSRLATRIRQKDGLSYGVGSSLSANPLDRSGSFTTFAIYAPQNAERLETAFKEEIARALDKGFDAKEMDEARSGWLQSRQVSRSQDAGLARTLASYLFLGRTLEFDARQEAAVKELKPETVTAALRKHLALDKISMYRAGDFAGAAAKAATAGGGAESGAR